MPQRMLRKGNTHIFLDYLETVEVECKATWDERHRYKNQFVLRWKDEKNPGKMSIQDDFKKRQPDLFADG